MDGFCLMDILRKDFKQFRFGSDVGNVVICGMSSATIALRRLLAMASSICALVRLSTP